MRLSVIYISLLHPLRCSAHRRILRDLSEPSDLPSDINENVLVDVRDLETHASVTPLFFHIPKAGGTTIQDLTAFCLHLVTASEVGAVNGHDKDTKIGKFSFDDGATFVNVDTTSKGGLKRAHDLGFVKADLADLVITGFIPQATHALFDEDHKASMFTIFRRPADRAVSLFYYLQDATWEKTYHPDWKNMTLEDYLKSPYMEQDWMTRSLVGKYTGNLDDDDLATAKELVSTRMWVGLITEMEESINRFGAVYGWNQLEKWDECVGNKAHHGSNMHKHPKVNPKSDTWKLLQETNMYDLQLYNHAVSTFEEQGQFFTDFEENY